MSKISTMGGYAFEYEGRGNPMKGRDDDWKIVVIDAMAGQLIGRRKIDGTDHYVLRVGDRYYAQTTARIKI